MRILLCAEITCGSTRKTVNLHVELVSDEVGVSSDSVCTSLQECPEMLQAGTCRDGKNLITMESPGQAVAHIQQW
jgi:hypothetical protein